MATVGRVSGEDQRELRGLLGATRLLLERASRAWAAFSCPSSGRCCQLEKTGLSPWLWPSEWALIRDHLAARGLAVPPRPPTGSCPFLSAGRCSVYEVRPLGCRTYFCGRRVGPAAEPVAATRRIDAELAGLNIAHDPDGAPRPIEAWASEL